MTDAFTQRIEEMEDPRQQALWRACKRLPSDFEPYGERSNDERGSDCSCGCKFWREIWDERDGPEGQGYDLDWGVCLNPESPRAGLLTWEHMGCHNFVYEPDEGEADDGA